MTNIKTLTDSSKTFTDFPEPFRTHQKSLPFKTPTGSSRAFTDPTRTLLDPSEVLMNPSRTLLTEEKCHLRTRKRKWEICRPICVAIPKRKRRIFHPRIVRKSQNVEKAAVDL
ncbi:hypothetical protein Avbf_14708 [Armadillidium vulgare]|nr:hypothetical protein Avbf_14708 [Armadillidium vulgare]